MKLRLSDIPKDHPVRPLRANQSAHGRLTCGTCGLSWDDTVSTSYTPAPSGRCPFEHFHFSEADNVPAVIRRMVADGYAGRGNVWGTLQYSGFIRPHCATECNGFKREPGQLRAFDLKPFRDNFPLALRLANRYAHAQESLVLYAWKRARPYSDGGGTIVYGATIADEHHVILSRLIDPPRYAKNAAVVHYLERAAGLRSHLEN